MTPLIWLLLSTTHNKKSMRGFAHLLTKETIKPELALKTRYFSNVSYSLFQFAAMAKESEYLEMIFEYYKPSGKELNLNSVSSAIDEAASVNNLKNFKLLLEYGIDINRILYSKSGDHILTQVNIGGDRWPFVYYLLINGADYMNGDKPHGEFQIKKPYLFWYIEDSPGDNPAHIINCCKGIDYRQKVIDWLEKEKDIKLNPWMPKDQKYIEKNGEKILLVKKDGQWKEYKKTFEHFFHRYWTCEEPIRKLFRKIWNTVYIGL